MTGLQLVLRQHKLWLTTSKREGSKADLSKAYLSRADLSGADLSGAYLSGAYLSEANLSEADLSGAYLSEANLSKADLSGANLSGANLSGVKGLASKQEEIAEAARILAILGEKENELEMSIWHTCDTSHCLAGWSCPNLDYPGNEASRKMPTLAKYFYDASNEEALAALERVATGLESVWQ